MYSRMPTRVDDRRTLLRIGSRGDIPSRLVQQNIAMMLRQLDAPAIHADVVVRRIGLRAELADRRAVHGDAALEHQLLGGAPRGDAGLRENFLQPFHDQSVATKTRKPEEEKSCMLHFADGRYLRESQDGHGRATCPAVLGHPALLPHEAPHHRHRRTLGRRQRHRRARDRRRARVPARRQRRDVPRGGWKALRESVPLDDEEAMASSPSARGSR